MSRSKLLITFFMAFFSISLLAQTFERKELEVPKVDPSAITLDGVMDEAEWNSAAEINMVTSTSYEIFANSYFRDGLTEPEFDEMYARLLWAQDTLFVFMHIDEFVNDSTNLSWDGQWVGDQLFISLSNRLGMDMKGWYDGNSYAAPDGPYHFWILGEDVTLNGGNETYVPEEFRGCEEDSLVVFDPAEFAEWGISIDTITGVWNVEMRIYNPHVTGQSRIGFNIGGSIGSDHATATYGDAYGYYTWQPNVPDDPFADPFSGGDPGFYNLANSEYWAILKFLPGQDDYLRHTVDVPVVQPGVIQIDAQMDEAAWQNAGQADLVTATSYNIFANSYYRDGLTEPEYDEYYGRMLWTEDTLYVFLNIDEYVNDSTNLSWDGKWVGDQLFVSLSNRLGVDMKGWYDGNSYAAPDGPYHFWILGDEVTLNGGDTTYVPEEYRECLSGADSLQVWDPPSHVRWATEIDTLTGVWKIEMAIYSPNVASKAALGFNIGGSIGSDYSTATYGDAYGYYTWQPNVPDDPFADPFSGGDPGFYNLANSEYWAVLNFTGSLIIDGVSDEKISDIIPAQYKLEQNYPNPFNPSTKIQFAVPSQSSISLRVYNALGQLVKTLVNNEIYTPGVYSVNWDATRLASGVYFYTLETQEAVITKKMILLK